MVPSNGVLYYRKPHAKRPEDENLRLVIPQSLQHDILHAFHDSLGAGVHEGISKTFAKIKRQYYWKNMYADVEKYVLSCLDFETGKGQPKFQGKSPGNITPTRPF